MDSMDRRNIIEKTGNQKFVFTAAHRNFTDFAMELAKTKISDVEA